MAFAAYYQLLRALPALRRRRGAWICMFFCVNEKQTNIAVVINILQSTMTHVSDEELRNQTEPQKDHR